MSRSNFALFVDSTVRFKWELKKEIFDNCEFGQSIQSDNYIVRFGTEDSEWFIKIYPKGEKEEERNTVAIDIVMEESDNAYEVLCGFGIETDHGYWPKGDLVEKLYSRRGVDYNNLCTFDFDKFDIWKFDNICKTEEFTNQFVENKVTLVVTLVFHMEKSKSLVQQRQVADNFVEEISTFPLQEDLSDITVICGKKLFLCHRVLLAARSKYFEALFRNEPQKKEVKIEEASPEIVAAMLEFMSKGLIPGDIDAKARDLVMLADMYGVELLIKICLNSMVKTLSPDNVIGTLITVDKLKHAADDHHEKILDYIKKEATKVVKADNWENFVKSYPSLVTDIVLAACNSKS